MYFERMIDARLIERTMKKTLLLAAFCLAMAACTMPERADALLPRKDSLALAKLYDNYEKAVNDLNEHTKIVNDDYYRQLEKIKKDFEASLAGNPNFAPVVALRNLLIDYQKEMQKEDSTKYDVDLKLEEDMPEEFVTHEKEVHFQKKWDEKLVKLLHEHPGFIECPPYMFEEALNMGVMVTTSADGRVRYYSYTSDQWRNLATVTCIRQYRSDSGRIIASLDKNSKSWGFVEEVHSLIVDGKTVYLLKKTHNEGYYYITFHAEAIEGEEITHPVIFDTENNEDPFVLYNLDGPEKVWVAKYDEKTKTIYMRVTNRDDHYRLNDDYVTYTFDGKMFMRVAQKQ